MLGFGTCETWAGAQLSAKHPIGTTWEGWQRAARPPEVHAHHHDSPRHAPHPTRAPTPLTLDLITQEKKELGDLLQQRVRYGRRAVRPPVAAAGLRGLTD